MRIFQQLPVWLAFVLCVAGYMSVDSDDDGDEHLRTRRGIQDEARLTTPELIQYHGYPSEVYTVNTEDEYVLEIHRIPFSPVSPQCRNKQKPAVLMMHDIISSSSDFIINGPGKSLGFLLADEGYDVWLGNNRGNRYSRNHKTLLPANAAFWDFSFHELGYYDLPAMYDFILNMTQQSQLDYVGHSQGTTLHMVMLATRPVYNQKTKGAYYLSPVAYLTYMRSPLLKFFAIFPNIIGLFFDIIGIGEFLPKAEIMAEFGQLVCKGMDFTQFLCTSPLFILCGFNANNMNKTMFPVYMGHSPSGSSTRQFIHYGQICYSGVFRRMDMGVVENMLTYGALQAPSYPLVQVTVPITLFYSGNDWFAAREDVTRLHSELPRSELYEIADPYFSHVDFFIGNNAKEMVFDVLIEKMRHR